MIIITIALQQSLSAKEHDNEILVQGVNSMCTLKVC